MLYECPHTGAVTTRTATLGGFVENETHKVSLLKNPQLSFNSYGYSPHPLSDYLKWCGEILDETGSEKPIIISIAAGDKLNVMLDMIEVLQKRVGSGRIGVEVNTSCPNLGGNTLLGYDFVRLGETISELDEYWREHTDLTIGLKLPPYMLASQILAVVDAVATRASAGSVHFLTSTNTIGNAVEYDGEEVGPVQGGMAGSALHGLALGNVQGLRRHLDEKRLGSVGIIGVGGIFDHDSYVRMRKAGAGAVGLATALGVIGPAVFASIHPIT